MVGQVKHCTRSNQQAPRASVPITKIVPCVVVFALVFLAGCGGMGSSTSGAPEIVSQPVGQTVSVGQTATFAVSATSNSPLTYQWRKNGSNIAGANMASYTTPATTSADDGSTFQVIVGNSSQSTSSAVVTLKVESPPSISTQPANQTAAVGQSATFSVTATGSAQLTYQWQKNQVNIAGATSAAYTTLATTLADNGTSFRVVVANSVSSVTSDSATLTVNSPPVISAQPTSQTVNVGQTATFSVTASGASPLSYQWQKNQVDIAGATAATYTTPATIATDSGATFRVMVKNPVSTITSSAATLTVNSPPTISTQPANQTVAAGQTATFSVVATGTAPLTYQWQKNQVNIPGATAASYTTPATAGTDNGSSFRVVVTNSVTSITSTAATLTVNSPPSITTQPVNQTVNAGQAATFSVVAAGTAPLTYQWQKNQVNIVGATAAAYTTPATTSADNGASFRVVVTNSVTSITSSAATLTVNSPPSITTQPASQTVNVGQTARFSVLATGTAPLSYQWQKNQVNIAGATAASYTTPATVSTDNGSSFRVVVTNSVTSVTSSAATLTVNSPPSITTQPTNQAVNVGQAATFSVVAAGTAPLTYQWQKNQVNIPGATAASYTTPATVSTDNGSSFRVTVTNPVTSVTSSAATLTVNSPPSITTQPANQAVNVGQAATFSVVAAGTAPLTYQWQKNQVNIPGATAASYTTPATVSTDNGSSFRVVVTNSVTSVTSSAATMTVNSPPSITTQPANQAVNVGQTATFSVVATGTAPLTYQWQKNQVNIAGATAASYTTPVTVITDNGSSFRVTVTNPVTSVTSTAATLSVAIPSTVSVLTQHNNNSRTGLNSSETVLTTSNVNVNQFGKLFAMPVDGQVYAQPLYVPAVTMNGGVHNVVVIATENDTVYAYDADSNAGLNASFLWKANVLDAAHGGGSSETPVNINGLIACNNVQPVVGITSTPVIDPASKTIYLEAKSTDGVNYFHRLHALDLTTGNEKNSGPMLITASVSGTGDGSVNGVLTFDSPVNALHLMNRTGLLLNNGTIYFGFASHCDFGPYHGWLFAYDSSTLAQKSVYVTTPNGGLGGFWMSGAGIAADANGTIFIASSNGDFDTTNVPATETSDALLKLGTTNQKLTLLDYFTPEDQAAMQTNDRDLGSGGVLLLPDQPGSFPHVLIEAGKNGKIYVVNRDQMTTNNLHYCSGCASDPQIIEESADFAVGAMFNLPAYWNNTLYFWGIHAPLQSIPITNGIPDFTKITVGTTQLGFPGGGISISSNGNAVGSAIVWAINGTASGSTPGPAVLLAYDASNPIASIYTSAQNTSNRDTAGNAVKFAVPTVANGKVYVGTTTEVDVYGLLPPQ